MANSEEKRRGAEEKPSRTWFGVVYKQLDIAASRFGEHRLTDWAAALTYYSMLSIFPGLLVLVSVLGLLGRSASDSIVGNIEGVAPSQVRDIFVSAIHGLQTSGTTAGVLLAVGLVTALYSSSSYIGAFIRAAGIVLDVPEDRRFYKTIPLRIGITALMMLLILLVGMVVVLTGPIAREVARATGVSANGIGSWDTFKWPVVIALAVLVLAILYNLGPNFDRTDRRWFSITPGVLLAVSLWLILSFAFSLYVGNFARYNKVYGSLAGVVIFLVWLWLSNVAVLLGLEYDAELKRYRSKHGHSAFSRRRLKAAREPAA
ncbi:MAG: YihY/virulence factor BrkB family protein [Solirubrobacterales bacterium]